MKLLTESNAFNLKTRGVTVMIRPPWEGIYSNIVVLVRKTVTIFLNGDVGNSINVCVLLGNESEKATVTKYMFLIVLFALPKFFGKMNKRPGKKSKN